jgi:hypothetical protein
VKKLNQQGTAYYDSNKNGSNKGGWVPIKSAAGGSGKGGGASGSGGGPAGNMQMNKDGTAVKVDGKWQKLNPAVSQGERQDVVGYVTRFAARKPVPCQESPG